MKKFTKFFLAALITALIVCLSIVPAFADSDVTVNGSDAKVGDTVTYAFSIEGSDQKVAGIHMVIFFDPDVLELKEVNADNLGSATINDNLNGNGQIIIVNSLINGAAGLKCSDKTVLATATFEVKKEGNTEISYFIPYLYDIDLVNIYDYKLTYDLGINGTEAVVDRTPVLADVSTLDGFDRGDFDNNVEGTGSGIKPVVTSANPVVSGGNGADNQGNSDPSEPDSGSDDVTVIAGVIIVAIIVIAIVVLVVLKNVLSKKSNKNS